MRGTFSKLPADTLAAALAPVAHRCNQLDWAVDLYTGPLRFHYWKGDDPRTRLPPHPVQGGLRRGWFGGGFLPGYAACLIPAGGGYYVGFDARTLTAAELARRVGG